MHLLSFSHRSLGALLTLIFTCAIPPLHATESPKKQSPLPLEVFYKGELVEDIELSPDGTHLLALKNVAGDTVVMVLEIATGKVFYPTKTDNKRLW